MGSSARMARGDECHGARHGDALLLAARQLPGLVRQALAQADALQHRARPALGVGGADAANQRRHHDVLERREVRQQMVELEDEADLAVAERCLLAFAHGRRCQRRRTAPYRRWAGRACRGCAAGCSCRHPIVRRWPPSHRRRPRGRDRSARRCGGRRRRLSTARRANQRLTHGWLWRMAMADPQSERSAIGHQPYAIRHRILTRIGSHPPARGARPAGPGRRWRAGRSTATPR